MILRIQSFSNKVAVAIVFSLFICINAGANPRMVKDIWSGEKGGGPKQLTDVNGTLFFCADNGIHGRELWKSDGTATGTVMVKDIHNHGNSNPHHLTNVDGTLFFSADDGIHGRELWKSDGTATGTVMVKNINSNFSDSSDPKYLTNVAGTLFFNAYHDSGPSGEIRELWKSDGTSAGTIMVADLNSGNPGDPQNLIDVNGTLFFTISVTIDTSDSVLYKSDGTEAGTIMITGTRFTMHSPEQLACVNTTLFFSAVDEEHGRELWKTDGTSEGTVLVGDIFRGPLGSNPSRLTHCGLILAFVATDGVTGRELWGSHAGLDEYLIKDIYRIPWDDLPSSDPDFFTVWQGTMFFAATAFEVGRELWKSNGTLDGTVMIKDINPTGSSNPEGLVNNHGIICFSADDGHSGRELYRSDGSSRGTFRVLDINPHGSSHPTGFTYIGYNLFFTADDGTNGRELWKYNVKED